MRIQQKRLHKMIVFYENTYNKLHWRLWWFQTTTQDDCSLWEYKRKNRVTSVFRRHCRKAERNTWLRFWHSQILRKTFRFSFLYLFFLILKFSFNEYRLSRTIVTNRIIEELKEFTIFKLFDLHLHYDYKRQKEHKSSHDTNKKKHWSLYCARDNVRN